MRPEDFRSKNQRNIKELPAEPGTMTAIGAVYMFTMFGVGDREIADALRLPNGVDDVLAVRRHPAYAQLFETVQGELLNANSDLIQGRIAAYSHDALDRVAELSDGAQNEMVALKASQDILDRAGVRPQDNVDRRQTGGNELRIVIIESEKEVTLNLNQ